MMPHWDWSINVGTVCSVLLVLGAIINYGSKVVRYMRGMNFRVNVMWAQFTREHPELAQTVDAQIEAEGA